jgi:hypothetical protein
MGRLRQSIEHSREERLELRQRLGEESAERRAKVQAWLEESREERLRETEKLRNTIADRLDQLSEQVEAVRASAQQKRLARPSGKASTADKPLRPTPLPVRKKASSPVSPQKLPAKTNVVAPTSAKTPKISTFAPRKVSLPESPDKPSEALAKAQTKPAEDRDRDETAPAEFTVSDDDALPENVPSESKLEIEIDNENKPLNETEKGILTPEPAATPAPADADAPPPDVPSEADSDNSASSAEEYAEPEILEEPGKPAEPELVPPVETVGEPAEALAAEGLVIDFPADMPGLLRRRSRKKPDAGANTQTPSANTARKKKPSTTRRPKKSSTGNSYLDDLIGDK